MMLLLAALILLACSKTTDKIAFPFEIDLEQVKELRVNTYTKDGSYKMDAQWSKFIDVVGQFDYQKASEEKIKEIEARWENPDIEIDFYGVVFDSGEERHNFFLYDDKLITYRIELSNLDKEFEFFIAKDKDIITLQEELSQLNLEEGIKIGKPVIYLYPEEEMDIEVFLKPKGVITLSYPEYDNGWFVTAKPNGELRDRSGKKYPYLFWEGDIEFSGGFEEAEGTETIAHQELKPVKRQGYTVVEWGGAESGSE